MKMYFRSLLLSRPLSTGSPCSQARRGLLRKFIAGLAAYSTSFFVANNAHAFACSECDGPCSELLTEGKCLTYRGECDGPNGYKAWGWWVNTGSSESGCCDGEYDPGTKTCCELYTGGIPQCLYP